MVIYFICKGDRVLVGGYYLDFVFFRFVSLLVRRSREFRFSCRILLVFSVILFEFFVLGNLFRVGCF